MDTARNTLLLIAQIIAIVLFLVIFSDIREFKAHQASYQPQPAPIDYERINQMVTSKISELPLPQDGKNGTDGEDGQDGKDALINEEALRKIVEEEVSKIPKPKDGVNGQDAISIILKPEFRTNPGNGNFEWRIEGDDSWQTISSVCQIVGVCNGQTN